MEEDNGFLKAPNYGRFMSRKRFEDILNYLLAGEKKDDQIMQLINAVNCYLKQTLKAGTYLAVDESMVKSYHKGLKRKMKIIREPRPIGNEFKNVCVTKLLQNYTNCVTHGIV